MIIYKIVATKKFEKDIKILRRKFKSIEDDIEEIVFQLKRGEFIGDIIKGLKINDTRDNVVKVRVANSDTHVGKSNGYRIIYLNKKSKGVIHLLTIYYKKEKSNISNKELQELILKYCL